MNAVQVRTARSFIGRWGFVALIAASLPAAARAQTVEQTFDLQVGWNALYVEVDPDPSELDTLLAGLEVKSVWVRDDDRAGGNVSHCADDADDSVCLASTDSGWRVWFPADRPERAIRSLTSVHGGRVYLVEAGQAATWTVRGRPNATDTRWRQGFDLGGFHVTGGADAAPTFGRYLAGSVPHQEAAIFEINADGSLSRVRDPDDQRIVSGKGYWVETARNTKYDGPIRIDPRSLRGVELLPGAAEAFIEIENLTPSEGTVTITEAARQVTADSVATGEDRVPLVWYDFAGESQPQWRDLDNVHVGLASKGTAGAKRILRVGVRRAELAEPDGESASERTGVLTLGDGQGFRRWLPIRSRGDNQSGLWVGEVTVNEVLFLAGQDAEPTPTASEFVFRIIIHRSASEYRLLREVVLVYDDEQDAYILVTPSCFELLGETRTAPRVSSANFSFEGDLLLAGTFATQLTASITSQATDSLNPFLHPFNPTHDEGFDFTRNITLNFDADGGGDPEWGVTRLAGTYEETIIGLHRNQLEVRGRFDLRRVSYTDTLCGP